MSMDFGLFQQQTMKLAMTNELRQAITILQYSALDLNEYLLEQQLENPLIELKERTVTEEVARQKMNDTPIYDGKSSYRGEDDYSPVDHIRENEEGLQDYLLNQIRLLNLDRKTRSIAMYLALSLDQNGYLHQSDTELMEEAFVTEETLEKGMETLFSLEPYGVGARTLRECLLIQLKHMGMEDSLTERVVSRHLELLAKNQFKKIAKAELVTVEDVQSVADFIKTLNPKPGAEFNRETPKYVVPDVTVLKINEDYVVRLNEQSVPKIFMNRDYEQMVKNKQTGIESYMKQKYDQFNWIKRSIEQRQQTILKVTKSIVNHQFEFFNYGASHLKPLTLKAVAEEVGVHESTVSRATTNKYVQTPRGLHELKYFFVSTVGRDSSKSSSSEKVKTHIKRLVNEENKQKPLSDQKLSDLLKKDNQINVSRRTLAKYREEMQIPSSSQRKRY
ncbi:RNA polymerase sigma-54 factor [Salipaludibacillus neizhouensis]|uniref:RNA polymerase sigma-54 factor n=1 Tax=Salipaludibacillus neizhouensis TaxID=885475 RepID=A0A3A9K891_9BACI|nr:RNA polymerase factor sigma-54 [Salipaludibacillus neizhouensis]RKL68419.1 RNA polymerase sigma-54 factor [Salipaludibacillus neizhouensis]